MSNSDAKARELTRHIQNPKMREKVSAFLRDTLHDLDAIGNMSDEHAFGGEKNLRDGTPLTTLDALEEKQRKRVETLRELTRGSFEDDSAGDSDTLIEQEEIEPEIDKRHRYGYTRLMQAVVDHDIQTVKNCLSLGANKYIPDNGGNTPYEKAVKLGYSDLAAVLAD